MENNSELVEFVAAMAESMKLSGDTLHNTVNLVGEINERTSMNRESISVIENQLSEIVSQLRVALENCVENSKSINNLYRILTDMNS